MKDLSNKELVHQSICTCGLILDDKLSRKHEAELLSRLNRLEELEKLNKSHVQGIINLEKQIEDMKCCGNCKEYSYHEPCDTCFHEPKECCDNRKSDNLTREERK